MMTNKIQAQNHQCSRVAGRAINISHDPSGGVLRARYRNGLTDQELLTPNKAELFKIKLTCNKMYDFKTI